MDILVSPLDIKLAGDQLGSFEGYASVFGVVDTHRDVVLPGAFNATVAKMKARGFNVPMYFNHGARLGVEHKPVGVWDNLVEDDKGLAVKGRILGLDTDLGRYNYELVKGGAMRGISIGYRVPPGGAVYGRSAADPRRQLKQIDLGEISLVDDPSNHLAAVMAIKAAGEIKTIREFEDFLRDAGGYSHAAAKAIAAGGFKASEPRDEDEAVAAALRRNIDILTRKD